MICDSRKMDRRRRESRLRLRSEEGQVTVFVLLALSIFLLAFIGFAVDMTNLWFHRQKAQGAADAACQAGVMDLLLMAQGTPTPGPGFAAGVPFECSPTAPNQTSGPVPCRYAALNGYNGGGLITDVESNRVWVSFPGTVPGVTPPDPGLAQVPFIRVDVMDRVKLTFSTLVSGQATSDVHAYAECAVVEAEVPIPIIVLHPSCPHSFQMSGNPCVKIIGGPSQSVQVNSSNASAACTTNSAGCPTGSPGSTCTGGGGNLAIDLSEGGENFNGSVFGTFGGPSDFADGFYEDESHDATWVQPHIPINDPYAKMPEPDPLTPLSLTDLPAGPVRVDHHVDGCPDVDGCDRYMPGKYTSAIEVKNTTAIFDPGLYYITGVKQPVTCSESGTGCVPGPKGNCHAALILTSGSTVRPSTAGDGTGGVQFYLSGDGSGTYGSVVVTANSGADRAEVDPFYTDGGLGANPVAVCPGGTPPIGPAALPASVTGNVLLGPCKNPFTGAPSLTRGVIFFQDRANNDPNGQPALQGGGSMLVAGTLYFHHCPGAPAPCDLTNDYKAFLALGGTPGSTTRVFGNIITDQLIMSGNPQIVMVLDPDAVFPVLKATLVR